MATLEVGYRSANEYAYDNQRPKLSEEQLCVDSLYVGMFSLGGDDQHEAARQICRITDMDVWGRVYDIELEILDEDFQVQSRGWVLLEDGDTMASKDLSIGGEPVEACYFKKPYFGWVDKVMEHSMAIAATPKDTTL